MRKLYSVDANRLSDKLVQSVTVKSEPQAVHDVCLRKDAEVKSEKDVKNPAMSEKDKTATPFGKEPQKKRGHRSRFFSSDSEGDKPPRHSVIRLPKYDVMSIPFLTFKAEFNNAAAYNKWSDSDQLAQVKACLTLTAANVMWDSDPTNVEDHPGLWQALADRFGGHDLTEKDRTQLRARVRKPNESLSILYADIKKLSAMGCPGPTFAAKEAIILLRPWTRTWLSNFVRTKWQIWTRPLARPSNLRLYMLQRLVAISNPSQIAMKRGVISMHVMLSLLANVMLMLMCHCCLS